MPKSNSAVIESVESEEVAQRTLATTPSFDTLTAAPGTFLPQSEVAKQQLREIYAVTSAGNPVHLTSEPGAGKSSTVNALAAALGVKLITVIGSQYHSVEATGLPTVDDSNPERPVTRKALPDWFEDALANPHAILFFDEFRNTKEGVQAALLVFVQTRVIQGIKLPRTVRIIMASNPLESSADGTPLTAPMANRMTHLDFVSDDEDWFLGMSMGWGKVEEDKHLALRLADERANVATFLRNELNREWLRKGRSDDEEDAYPSERSWSSVAENLAWTDPEDTAARTRIIEGTVGDEAAVAFQAWIAELDLPDIEPIIEDPSIIDWGNETPDRAYAILNLIAGRTTVENVEKIANVLIVAAQMGVDQDLGAGLVRGIIMKTGAMDEDTQDDIIDSLSVAYGEVLQGSGLARAM